MKPRLVLALLITPFIHPCHGADDLKQPTTLPMKSFGNLSDGTPTHLYTLQNTNGLVATVLDYGATLVSMKTPDKEGKMADITHGFDSVAGYEGSENPYFGATVGRYGNRIDEGKFSLEGNDYQLAINNSPNHLHGGPTGFNKRMWEVIDQTDSPASITLRYISEDGEENYPGKLITIVSYTLNDDDELIWEAKATTDKATIINLVHHTYWNLSNDQTSTINNHLLTLHADKFLPTDDTMIPTGEIMEVAGTPMDFTAATKIGKRLGEPFAPLQAAGGYDHCWILRESAKDDLKLAARLEDPSSGRSMEISTNQPGIQFYGGNFLAKDQFEDPNPAGKGGDVYPYRSACCLETQRFPDSPNQPDFPSPVLMPGETYHHLMIHKFR